MPVPAVCLFLAPQELLEQSPHRVWGCPGTDQHGDPVVEHHLVAQAITEGSQTEEEEGGQREWTVGGTCP